MSETPNSLADFERDFTGDVAHLSKWVVDVYNELEILVHNPARPHREVETLHIEGQCDILPVNIFANRTTGWVHVSIIDEQNGEYTDLEALLQPKAKPEESDGVQGPALFRIANVLEACRAAVESSSAEVNIGYDRS